MYSLKIRKNDKKKYFIFFFLAARCLYGQQEILVSLGSNVVDDSFTSYYKPFNISEQWHAGKLPSYFSFSTEIATRLFLEFQLSSNYYEKGKLVNGSILLTDKNYFAMDFLSKYRLLNPNYNFLNTALFDPFVSVGIGNSKIDKTDFYTLNYGLGSYFWFPKSKYCNCTFNNKFPGNIGVLISGLGKSSFSQSLNGNQIQYAFGLVCRLD